MFFEGMEPGDGRTLLAEAADLREAFSDESQAFRERWRQACLEVGIEYRFATTVDAAGGDPARLSQRPPAGPATQRDSRPMGFLAPSILLGLLAAGLPWLIHLIGKRRATPVKFAAMQLLLRSERRVAARRRLRADPAADRPHRRRRRPAPDLRPPVRRTAQRPARGEPGGPERGHHPGRFGQHAAAGGRQHACSIGPGTRIRTLLRQLPADADVALLTASEGSEPRVGELSLERPAPAGGAGVHPPQRAIGRLSARRCAGRRAHPGHLPAAGTAHLRGHRPAGGWLGRRARPPRSAAMWCCWTWPRPSPGPTGPSWASRPSRRPSWAPGAVVGRGGDRRLLGQAARRAGGDPEDRRRRGQQELRRPAGRRPAEEDLLSHPAVGRRLTRRRDRASTATTSRWMTGAWPGWSCRTPCGCW